MSPDRPNILLICTDQQRFDALAASGNAEIDTPHLDPLAADGAIFTNCYVQAPVCAPSRGSLMSGLYLRNHGLYANGVRIPGSIPLLPSALAAAGYDRGLVGKGRDRRSRTAGVAGSPIDVVPTQAHYSDWIGEETVRYLSGIRPADQPFFFIANFFDPHHCFAAPKEYVDRYRADQLSRPNTVPGELDGKPPILAEASRESYAGHAPGYLDYSAEELQEIKANYYAMVSLVDDEVGRILQMLRQQGLAENTVVIFTSDHGEMLGDHQLMLKGPMLYDCAIKVPLLIRWPGRITAGTRIDELVEWIDLTATITELAGTALPRCQGLSLRGLATGTTTEHRGWALCEYRDNGHPYDPPVHTTMVRSADTKIIVHHGPPASGRDRTGELYDLASDPGELINRWDDPDHAAQRQQMTELLLDVMVATEDRSQERKAFW